MGVGNGQVELKLVLEFLQAGQAVGVVFEDALFVVGVFAGIAHSLVHSLDALLAVLAPAGWQICFKGSLASIGQ